MTATRHTDGDVRIAYEVHPSRAGDDAPTVLLVHGLGYARWGWHDLPERLAERLHVVAFDNRGIGASDVPDGPYDAAGMAADAVAVLDAVGAERAHVVGSSLGGMIAQELALGWPERVSRLVLLSTTPGGADAAPMPQVTVDLIQRMPTLPPEEALRQAVANALAPAHTTDALVEEIVAHRLADPQDPAGWQAQAHAGVTYDGGGRLGAITAPALVLHGTDDVVVAPANGRLLAERIPDARLVELEGHGHLPFWEDPERVAAELLAFLAPSP
jgi:3-oxoadipate enol-lactonase